MEYIKKLKDLKSKDILDTAKRVYMLLNKIYKYAVTLEYVPHNIIPASKMKTKIEFILPLSNQVIEILKEVQQFTGTGKYVFPSFTKKDKTMSDNTLIGALRRMGYTKEEFVPHRFRAMFSTIAYENVNSKDGHNFTGEVIEALLAHKETNKVKEAYYKDAMRGLIEWYADYLN